MAEDYGLLGGIGAGLIAFNKAYSDAQDRNLRIAQVQSEIEARKELKRIQENKNKKDEELGLYKAGAKRDAGGILTPDADNPYYQSQQVNNLYRDATTEALLGKEALEKMKAIVDARSKGLIVPGGEGIEISPEKRQKMAADEEMNKARLGLLAARANRLNAPQVPKAAPLDDAQKAVVRTLAQRKANTMAINSQIGSLIKQLEDPSGDPNQKAASAYEQLKQLNSQLGPDALGASEVERVGKFLSATPSPSVGKYSPGPDIEAFAQQVKNAYQRNQQSIEKMQEDIDSTYGRKSSSGLTKGLNQSISSNVPVKKEFNSKLNKTRITYSDGTTKILDGRK